MCVGRIRTPVARATTNRSHPRRVTHNSDIPRATLAGQHKTKRKATVGAPNVSTAHQIALRSLPQRKNKQREVLAGTSRRREAARLLLYAYGRAYNTAKSAKNENEKNSSRPHFRSLMNLATALVTSKETSPWVSSVKTPPRHWQQASRTSASLWFVPATTVRTRLDLKLK